jgi:hypothetical protein
MTLRMPGQRGEQALGGVTTGHLAHVGSAGGVATSEVRRQSSPEMKYPSLYAVRSYEGNHAQQCRRAYHSYILLRARGRPCYVYGARLEKDLTPTNLPLFSSHPSVAPDPPGHISGMRALGGLESPVLKFTYASGPLWGHLRRWEMCTWSFCNTELVALAL